MEGLLSSEKIGLALIFAVPGLIILYVRGQFVANKRPSLADSDDAARIFRDDAAH